MPLPPGLYEALITRALTQQLDQVRDAAADRGPLLPAEAGDRLALHFGQVLLRAIEALAERERVPQGVDWVAGLVAHLHAVSPDLGLVDETPTAAVLRALAPLRIDGTPTPVASPLTPLLDTALLTNARGEPALLHELGSEIPSADAIDVLMAFIRLSGINPLRDRLKRHVADGRPLRVLTTIYTGSTELRALEVLRDLGAEVRISYDASTTRLHAKSWRFYRESGYSTAYVGSSNLTHSAQVDGLEWNLRISGVRNSAILDRIEGLFEAYWHGGDFRPFDAKEFTEHAAAQRTPRGQARLSPIEVRLHPFQERLLEQVEIQRARGRNWNLLVAATGTGKTVMAAVDYARLKVRLPRARLLFVAHRRELLEQAQDTYRHVLREPSFGELWVGGRRPEDFEHVFASVQSLSQSDLAHLPADHFDVVVVDEFHHAEAKTYRRLLEHLKPRQLLGLTATPERADGLPVLDWFEGHIAAELRLWDAIDQQRLVPFQYYGVHDGLDLTQVGWTRGRGYDVEGLERVYTADDVWARRVLGALEDRVSDLGQVRGLGFCVSVGHARFMARAFSEAGVAATAVWGGMAEADRRSALGDLAAGRVNLIFSVDLFNEGIDLPTVDTLLLLRPTDSATLFLQQLGRGLRRHPDKASCLVLDFVAQHRREFRFDRKLRALLGGSRRDLEAQIERGFPFLPSGCSMTLDRVAQQVVLDNVRSAVSTRWTAKADELRTLGDVGLGRYLEESGLEIEDLHRGSARSWSDLREQAGLPTAAAGPQERPLRRAVERLLHIEDPARIDTLRRVLASDHPPRLEDLPEHERRILAMWTAIVFTKSNVVGSGTSLAEGLELLFCHPQVLSELRETLDLLEARIPHLGAKLDGHPHIPLRVHARYARAEIVAAVTPAEKASVFSWQTGTYFVEAAGLHLLPFTLDKSKGGFSPTTRYRDYAISPNLIHWESQSRTRADSETGRQYQRGGAPGNAVFLFCRPDPDTKVYAFLGPARYVRHHGERPMAITWELEHSLPGDLYAELAAAVA